MNGDKSPVMLQLAPLPRTQVGPFLLLGVDKDADKNTIEANWAQRLIWARKGLTRAALEDVNWAREMLSSYEQRVRSDAVSLNVDTTDGVLKKLRDRFHGKRPGDVAARPLDQEKWLAEDTPPTPVPPVAEARANVRVPELPRDVPAVRVVLDEYARAPVDPWGVDLDT